VGRAPERDQTVSSADVEYDVTGCDAGVVEDLLSDRQEMFPPVA
jgi:hypothetical protein